MGIQNDGRARGEAVGAASWRRAQWGREAARWALALFVFFTARSVVADYYVVPTGSMRPTVQVGDRVVVNKLAYGLRLPFSSVYLVEGDDPQVGDVVVLGSPDGGYTLLKRVVATPGDLVAVRSGRLIINGEAAEIDRNAAGGLVEALNGESHGVRLTAGGGPDWGPRTLPADRYLVMGDNRGDSYDGRMFGLVERSTIWGRAAAVFYRDGFDWLPL